MGEFDDRRDCFSKFVIGLSLMLLIYNYIRGKRLIAASSEAQYPQNGKPATDMITSLGKMEPVSIHLKVWKKKRLLVVMFFVIFTVVSAISIIYESILWTTSFIFLVIAINTLSFNKIPSFLIMNEGIYLDERFFKWEKLKYFSIEPVKMGSLGYGMFENSSDYTEVIFKPSNGIFDRNSVFLLDKNEVGKVRNLLLDNGVPEAESSHGDVISNSSSTIENDGRGDTKKQQTLS
ncbi:MAG: hypothetical protein LRY73_05760 [Bacillus sp. (in: Bacteria)]|nr:hypothetical protein [Bacillus sp. (in: firmicutes)]